MINIGTLAGLITLDDQATKSLHQFQGNLSKIGSSFTGAGAALSVGLTAPLVAAAGASLAFSASFESTTKKLVSLAGVTSQELQGVRDHILNLAPAVGIGPQALAVAMTKVSSTVSDSKTALSILDVAARGSAAGMGEAVDVAGALTAVINSYGKENITAAQAGDILTQTIKEGGAEAKELAPTLANVVPFAAQLGISFAEVGANIATVTKLGVPAAEAVTQLSSVMTALVKETSQGKDALKEVGLSYAGLRAEVKDKGLAETLLHLQDVFRGNETALTHVFGRIEAVRDIMAVSGAQANVYAEVLDKLKKSAGSLDSAFEEVRGTQVQTWAEVSAQIQVVAIKFGNALAPAMQSVLIAAKPLLETAVQLVQWFTSLPKPVQTTAIAIGAVAAAAGPFLFMLGGMTSGMATLTPLWGLMGAGITRAFFPLKLLSDQIAVYGLRLGTTTTATYLWETATIRVTTATKALWAAMVAHPLVAVTAAVSLLTLAWLKYRNSVEDANAATLVHKDEQRQIQKAIDNGASKTIDLAGAIQYMTDFTKEANNPLHLLNVRLLEMSKNGATGAEAANVMAVAVQDLGNKGLLSSTAMKEVAEKVKALNIPIEQLPPALRNIVMGLDLATKSGKTFTAMTDEQKDAVKKHEEAIRSLMTEIARGPDNATALYDVFKNLSTAQLENYDVQQRLVPAMDKLIESNNKLTPSMQKVYDAALKAKTALVAQQASLLASKGVTLSFIDSQKSLGLSEDQIAHKLGVTTEGLKKFMDQAGDRSDIHTLEAGLGSITEHIGKLDKELEKVEKSIALHELRKQVKDIENIAGDPTKGFFMMANGLEEVGKKSTELQDVELHLLKVQTRAEKIAGVLMSIGDIFMRLGSSTGGGLGDVLSGIGEGLQNYVQAVSAYQKATSGAEKAMIIAQSGADAVGTFQDIQQERIGAGRGIANMTMQGASIGTMIMPGWGTAIGAGVGALVGVIAHVFRDKTLQDIARDAGKDFGMNFSKETAEAIKKTHKEGGFTIPASELIHLQDIIKDAGGLTDKNLPLLTQRLHDVFSLIEMGQLSAAQGGAILNDNWETFAKAGTDAAGRLSKELKEILILNERFGTNSAAMLAYVNQQTDKATAGFNAMAKAVEGDKTSLAAMGQQAFVTYASMLASGMSQSQAIAAMGPGLDSLMKSYEALGLKVTDAGLASLMLQRTIIQQNPEVIAGIDGLTSRMIALDNIGLLNAETFQSMETIGMAMYVRLQAGAAAAGGTTKDALIPMQQWLHEAVKQAELLGIPLDDNTQMLVNQSKELKIWKDVGKTATDTLIDGITTLVDRFDKFLKQIAGMGPIPAPWANWGTPPGPPAAPGPTAPGMALGGIVPGYASGGHVGNQRYGKQFSFKPSGTDTQLIAATPGEGVVTVKGMGVLGQAGLANINSGQNPSDKKLEALISAIGNNGGGTKIIVVQGRGKTDDEIANLIMQVLPDKVLHNEGGVKSDLKAALDLPTTTWAA